MGILPASKWRFLRHLSLADNAMTSIPPASLAPLSNTLYSLDLSSNLFSQIPDSLASLTALRALNLSHCMIDSLQSLTRNPLPAITALNLRANRLQSLAGIEKLYPL
jgi:Leucine-rich repeat (LRR) protein